MLFNLKAVPRVDVNYDANEFFLSVSKEELLLQHKKDYEKFCITITYAITMLCLPHGFTHSMDDKEIAGLLDFLQSEEDTTGLAFVVEYRHGKPCLITGLEY